jgi:hypothetical protein
VAGETHAIDIGDDDLLPPWSTVFDVIAVTDFTEWVLVGGLMVQLHAYRASIPPVRPTKDVDMVVDVVTSNGTVQEIAGQLRTIGFEPVMPSSFKSPVYRFARGKEQVDLMVPDDLPSRIEPRLMRRPAFGVVAGKQAIRRRDTFEITSTSRTVTVGAPDVLGALIAKGAAYRVDSRDANRHLEDAALLLASIAAVRSLDLEGLSANDRKHLAWIAGQLLDPRAAPWRTLTEPFRERGQRQLGRILTAVSPPIQPR